MAKNDNSKMNVEQMKKYYKDQMMNYNRVAKTKTVKPNEDNKTNHKGSQNSQYSKEDSDKAVPVIAQVQPTQTQQPTQMQRQDQIQPQNQIRRTTPMTTQDVVTEPDMTISVENMYELYKEEHPMTGYIKVHAFSARRTYPVPNATVEIGKNFPQGRYVIAVLKTDSSGLTQTIPVPAAPKALSQQPGVKQPYSAFDIYIKHPNFADMRFYNVEVFQDVVSTQIADMVPYAVIPQGQTEVDTYERQPRNL